MLRVVASDDDGVETRPPGTMVRWASAYPIQLPGGDQRRTLGGSWERWLGVYCASEASSISLHLIILHLPNSPPNF